MATDLAVQNYNFEGKQERGSALLGAKRSSSPLLFLLELRSAIRTVQRDFCTGFVNRRILRLRAGEVGCQYLCPSSARSHSFPMEPDKANG
jgi:hypothetical protein